MGVLSNLFRNKKNGIAILICAAGIALNLILGTIVSKLGLPLYLDTVGTVVVAVMGGYLPGVTVGFATNIIKSFSDSSALYYGVLNVLIAFLAAHLAEKGRLKRPRGIIMAIFAFTLIGGGLGSLIPTFMDGLSYDYESLSGIFTGRFHLAVPLAHFISSFIMDFPDKALSVLLVLIILRLVPESYYRYACFESWRQTPLNSDETAGMEKKGVRYMSLRTKIMIVICASLVIVAIVSTAISLAVYRKTLIKEHKMLAQGTARIAASVLDPDRIDEYLETRGGTEDYEEKKQLLREILNSSTDIAYLYVYRFEEDGAHVVFDIETNDVEAFEIASVLPFDEGFAQNVQALLFGWEVEPVITNDEYGKLLTAYQPVYDSRGRCVCYTCADVDMEKLTVMERSFFVEMTTVFLGFFILLCVLVIWLTRYHIILPVNSITKWVDSFSDTESTQESLDEDVKMFRKLDIHTGDEIETLYRSLCRMILSEAEQMRSIRKLSDSTAKMQDGLIITMADMVENRDSDTGAHIQKTAAYVKIIVEGLKAKGYYAEKITPKFMSDVVRSAPLHDVGKINIPDEVLNKPGKLTDEEYEIMKKHTVMGKKIMEDAISTVEGENYLKEARNMAAYHHERWDGKGYPEGLHGEVIPLSARIMAVADVFDALSSPRVYKPAFPIEKALSIIEEGSGTQFDPKCVEVFMDSLAEVKVILTKYNQGV